MSLPFICIIYLMVTYMGFLGYHHVVSYGRSILANSAVWAECVSLMKTFHLFLPINSERLSGWSHFFFLEPLFNFFNVNFQPTFSYHLQVAQIENPNLFDGRSKTTNSQDRPYYLIKTSRQDSHISLSLLVDSFANLPFHWGCSHQTPDLEES